LRNADVGLIPFDVARHPDLVHGIHPLKLYEYLACELPVVATDWDELRALGSPARLCRMRDEHVAAIREAVAGGIDPGEGLTFVAHADWRERAAMLLDRLGLANATATDEEHRPGAVT
jgi:hypothetical protein